MANPMLQAENLAYECQEHFLFARLSFQIHAGQALHVEGINGAGKTSLLRILTGLKSPNLGQVLWQGKNIQDCREEYNASLLYIGHQAAIKAQLTPQENLQFNMDLTPNQSQSVTTALANMELTECANTPCQQLSAGQQRRVALARLWLNSSKIWILDEPFVALDKKGIANINNLIINHLSEGGIVIITSHQALNLQNCSVRHLLLD